MNLLLPLAPRYRLDDDSAWLIGIDPSRHYWIQVNGADTLTATIPGLTVSNLTEFKTIIKQWRSLQPEETMVLDRSSGQCKISCISPNCYAIEDQIDGALVWHLFDQETLESLLMTSHPDWKCSEKDLELGRQQLERQLLLSLSA